MQGNKGDPVAFHLRSLFVLASTSPLFTKALQTGHAHTCDSLSWQGGGRGQRGGRACCMKGLNMVVVGTHFTFLLIVVEWEIPT